MAVEFTADLQRYGYNASWGTLSAFSIATWVKINSDRNDFSTVWSLYNSTSHFVTLRTDAGGSALSISSAGGPGVSLGSVSLTVGAWYYFGFSFNGSDICRLVYRTASDTSFTQITDTGAGNLTGNFFRLGDDHNGSNWLNGSITAVKIWFDDLDQAELENESYTYKPAGGSLLEAWYPWISTADAEVDFAGNGNTLVAAAGTASSDFAVPPISWWRGAPQKFIQRPTTFRTVNKITETDKSRRLAVSIGRSQETDRARRGPKIANRTKFTNTSRQVRPVSIYKPGQATQTDTARLITHKKLRVVNRAANQISTALHISRSLFVGRVQETDISRSLGNRLVLRASSTNTVPDRVNVNKHNVVEQVTETEILRLFVEPFRRAPTVQQNTSRPIQVRRTYTLGGPVSVAQTARQVRAAKTHTMSQASEISKSRNLPIDAGHGIVVEVDVAPVIGHKKTKTIHWPLARICRTVYKVSERDSVLKPMLGVDKATETDAARSIREVKLRGLLSAAEHDTSISFRLNFGETDESRPITEVKKVLVRTVGGCGS